MKDDPHPYRTPKIAHATRRKRMRQLLELNVPDVIVANECLILLRSSINLGINPTYPRSIAETAALLNKLVKKK